MARTPKSRSKFRADVMTVLSAIRKSQTRGNRRLSRLEKALLEEDEEKDDAKDPEEDDEDDEEDEDSDDDDDDDD